MKRSELRRLIREEIKKEAGGKIVKAKDVDVSDIDFKEFLSGKENYDMFKEWLVDNEYYSEDAYNKDVQWDFISEWLEDFPDDDVSEWLKD